MLSDVVASSFILQHFVLALILKGKFLSYILLSIIVFSFITTFFDHAVPIGLSTMPCFPSGPYILVFTLQTLLPYVEFCILGLPGSNSM